MACNISVQNPDIPFRIVVKLCACHRLEREWQISGGSTWLPSCLPVALLQSRVDNATALDTFWRGSGVRCGSGLASTRISATFTTRVTPPANGGGV